MDRCGSKGSRFLASLRHLVWSQLAPPSAGRPPELPYSPYRTGVGCLLHRPLRDAGLKLLLSPFLFQQSSHEPKGTRAGAPGTELLEFRPADAQRRAGGAQHLSGSLSEHRVSRGNASVRYFLSLGKCLQQGWCADRPQDVANPALIWFGVEQGAGVKENLYRVCWKYLASWRRKHLFVLGPLGTQFYWRALWLVSGREMAPLT